MKNVSAEQLIKELVGDSNFNEVEFYDFLAIALGWYDNEINEWLDTANSIAKQD